MLTCVCCSLPPRVCVPGAQSTALLVCGSGGSNDAAGYVLLNMLVRARVDIGGVVVVEGWKREEREQEGERQQGSVRLAS